MDSAGISPVLGGGFESIMQTIRTANSAALQARTDAFFPSVVETRVAPVSNPLATPRIETYGIAFEIMAFVLKACPELPPGLTAAVESREREERAAVSRSKEQTLHNVVEHQRNVDGDSGIDHQEFSRRLMGQAQQNFQRFSDREGHLADTLTELGKRNRQARGVILVVYGSVSAFFAQVWDALAAYLCSLVRRFCRGLNEVECWFRGVGDSMDDWRASLW